MEKVIMTKEIILMCCNKTKSLSNSIVVDIENDIVTLSVRNKNNIDLLTLNKNSKYVPIEINTPKPIESIELGVSLTFNDTGYCEHEVKIYSKDISTKRNKTYIHRDTIIPPHIKGEIMIIPLGVLSVNYKDGDILTLDESTELELHTKPTINNNN